MDKNREKKIVNLGNILFWIMMPLLFVITSLTFLSFFYNPFDFRIFSVLTGSMEPHIQTGSLIMVREEPDYGVGDVITYKSAKERYNDNMKVSTVTHRIIEKDTLATGDFIYTTKGDANEAADREEVSDAQIIGKVQTVVPYLGYVINFTRTPMGFFILVMFPITLVIIEEIRKIIDEVRKLRKKPTIDTPNKRLNLNVNY